MDMEDKQQDEDTSVEDNSIKLPKRRSIHLKNTTQHEQNKENKIKTMIVASVVNATTGRKDISFDATTKMAKRGVGMVEDTINKHTAVSFEFNIKKMKTYLIFATQH